MQRPLLVTAALTALAACTSPRSASDPVAVVGQREWLAGDHHVHSRYSVAWNDSTTPPTPVIAGDAAYPIPANAAMARHHGLSWMVSTDHGGPNHSKLNLEVAYPEVQRARQVVPDLVLFYGMEFDTPGADHSSLIMPHSDHEHTDLYEIEHRFAKRDAHPPDVGRDVEPKMIEALRYMAALRREPVLIANHPARSALDYGKYGQDTPSEFRNWNDAAPRVSVGMEGAPGHQASALNRDGSVDTTGARGGYRRAATMGGFHQMSARVGGLWDALLGEGRRWWITATSDSHRNWREGGSDFWPGEYAKTYVYARKTHDDILDGVRHGRVFVTTGDLISELYVTATSGEGAASLGDSVAVVPGGSLTVTIRLRDPETPNHHGDRPRVQRVDLIAGDVTGRVADRSSDHNHSTRVVRRFSDADWRREGEYLVMTHTLTGVERSGYVRVRGTNGTELEPTPDPLGEDPWRDLWFYANPIFFHLP